MSYSLLTIQEIIATYYYLFVYLDWKGTIPPSAPGLIFSRFFFNSDGRANCSPIIQPRPLLRHSYYLTFTLNAPAVKRKSPTEVEGGHDKELFSIKLTIFQKSSFSIEKFHRIERNEGNVRTEIQRTSQ